MSGTPEKVPLYRAQAGFLAQRHWPWVLGCEAEAHQVQVS